jgi:hypothetical protein
MQVMLPNIWQCHHGQEVNVLLIAKYYRLVVTYTSTRSTFTPQGSVASSSVDCIAEAIDSRSERISPKFFVPRTFLELK